MSKQHKPGINNDMITAISTFLSAPPEGTPVAVIEAFSFFGAESLLLPDIFIQTVEQAPIAISITDPQAYILYVNKAFEQLTGYSRYELIGKKPSILSSQSTPPAVYKNLWMTIKDKRVWTGKLVNHRKDKDEYLAELSISPVLSETGDISYFLGMQHDISQIYKLEQSLKFQKSLAEAAINAAPMVVAMVDMTRCVVMKNTAYKVLAEEFSESEPAELFIDALSQQTGFKLEHETNKAFSNIEICLQTSGRDLVRWFSCSGGYVYRPDESAEHYFTKSENEQRYLLLIANDITLQRQRTSEASLNMLRNNMAEQQSMQSLREAMSASVYKLQLPLNVMKAALSVPGEDYNKCSLRATLLQALKTSDEAMNSLLGAIPAPESEQPGQFNVNTIIHEVIKLSTEKLLASGVVIDWCPQQRLPHILAQENALRRLFKYLLDNAIEAVNESAPKNKMICLETTIDDQDFLIKIIDNGTGLQENLRLKVFEPFFCGWKKSGNHAGMGLTMAQEIIIQHAGSIEFDTTFMAGCCLLVRLPINNKTGEQ